MRFAVCCLLLAGCSSGEPDPSGEEWARKTLGDGARSLKAQSHAPSKGELDAAYAPRPFVVIEFISRIPGAEGEPHFHPLNATLPAGLVAKAVDDVQSLVLVRKIIQSEKVGTFRFKRRTQNVFSNKPVQVVTMVIRDENGRFIETAGDMIEGHDDAVLRAFLEKLPETAPAER